MGRRNAAAALRAGSGAATGAPHPAPPPPRGADALRRALGGEKLGAAVARDGAAEADATRPAAGLWWEITEAEHCAMSSIKATSDVPDRLVAGDAGDSPPLAKSGKLSRRTMRRVTKSNQQHQQQQQQQDQQQQQQQQHSTEHAASKSVGRASGLTPTPLKATSKAAPSGSEQQSHKPPTVKSTEEEVLAAVRSLYKDELKPYGRILRKRLVEHSAAAGRGPVDIDAKHLREVCEASESLRTEAGEGGEWSTVLREEPPTFVDVYSTDDPYPEELWEGAVEYFSGSEWAEADLPGGRYACAQTLGERNIGFLKGYSLGQVCHIVQLAITTKKILGYLNGATVPYSRSQSMLKQSCAEMQRACTVGPVASGAGSDTPELPLATWDTVRSHLRHILKEANAAGRDTVPISNVKRLFRSDFQTELSETKLGHYKLTDLLQDERLRDICTLQLHDQGYVLVAQQVASPREIAKQSNDEDFNATEASTSSGDETHRQVFCPGEPLCFDDAESSSAEAAPLAAAAAVCSELAETSCTPAPGATMTAPTPMFSPSTAFFGDNPCATAVQRQPLPCSPATTFYQDAYCAPPAHGAQMQLPHGSIYFDSLCSGAIGNFNMQLMPMAPYYNSCIAGNVLLQTSYMSAPTVFYADAC